MQAEVMEQIILEYEAADKKLNLMLKSLINLGQIPLSKPFSSLNMTAKLDLLQKHPHISHVF